MSFSRLIVAAGLLVGLPVTGSAQDAMVTTYWTDVALERSDCPDATIRPGPTDITRFKESDSLTVAHAGQTYSGTVTGDGRFRTEPRELTFDNTIYRIEIAGRLDPAGFSALVTVGVRQRGADGGCSYTVKWTGRP